MNLRGGSGAGCFDVEEWVDTTIENIVSDVEGRGQEDRDRIFYELLHC